MSYNGIYQLTFYELRSHPHAKYVTKSTLNNIYIKCIKWLFKISHATIHMGIIIKSYLKLRSTCDTQYDNLQYITIVKSSRTLVAFTLTKLFVKLIVEISNN